MTSPASSRTRPVGLSRPKDEGEVLPLRPSGPWVVLTVALLALLALTWSATAWYPAACTTAQCRADAPPRILLHWVGMTLPATIVLGAAAAAVRARDTTAGSTRARLSPAWHGTVVGFVVMVLASGALVPTVALGLISPPLGVALVVIEWVALSLALDRMHLAARPASSPRRRLGQSFVVAAAVIAPVVALPLFSPTHALSAGMLQLALLQAGVAFVVTAWLSSRDPAGHGDPPREHRLALAAAVGVAAVVVGLAVVGLDLSEASWGGFGHDLRSLLQPYAD